MARFAPTFLPHVLSTTPFTLTRNWLGEGCRKNHFSFFASLHPHLFLHPRRPCSPRAPFWWPFPQSYSSGALFLHPRCGRDHTRSSFSMPPDSPPCAHPLVPMASLLKCQHPTPAHLLESESRAPPSCHRSHLHRPTPPRTPSRAPMAIPSRAPAATPPRSQAS
jgi:hypothetical protein